MILKLRNENIFFLCVYPKLKGKIILSNSNFCIVSAWQIRVNQTNCISNIKVYSYDLEKAKLLLFIPMLCHFCLLILYYFQNIELLEMSSWYQTLKVI